MMIARLYEAAMRERPLAERVAAKAKKPTADGKPSRYRVRKFSKLHAAMGKLRAKMDRDLRSSDPDRFLTALAIGMMTETGADIDDPELGILSWKKNQVRMNPSGAMVRFHGHDGARHGRSVVNTVIVRALQDAYATLEDDEDSLFSNDLTKVKPAAVAKYLKPFELSASDVRGFAANRYMRHRLKKLAGPLPEHKASRAKMLRERFSTALSEVAEIVGHEPETIRAKYLQPGMEETFLAEARVVDKHASSMSERIAETYAYDD